MQLIYTDESGINYSIKDGLFKDGPYIIYGGICVDEKKYFHLERLFIELIQTYFSIDDWKKEEVHATNMWNLKGYFSTYDQTTIKSFFNELLQLLVKLDIQTIIGVQKKTVNASTELQKKEEAYAIYSYFHGIELYLSQKSETGILIADDTQNSESSLFSKIFYDRSSWRIMPKNSSTPFITSKFKFESRLCFVLDNIHYVNSKNSLFVQIIDIVMYTIMRVWTYHKLKLEKNPIADINKVPIEKETFSYFASSVINIYDFDQKVNDVMGHQISAFIQMYPISNEGFLPEAYFQKIATMQAHDNN